METSRTATASATTWSDPIGHLVLIRHGSTEWSRSGQHTGLTDLPLLPEGEEDAYAVGRALAGRTFGLVLSSPLQRAWHTAGLAGFSPDPDPDLVEWDYGGYEGLTTVQIRQRCADPQWTIFRNGVIAGETPGETLEQVSARARRVLSRVAPILERQDVALVAHGHLLRVLAACYLELSPATGASLLLDAGSISVLEVEKGVPAIRAWNARPEHSAYAKADLPSG